MASNKSRLLHPPYRAGKVSVGLAYLPPPRVTFSADEERLQAALLGSRSMHAHPAQLWLLGHLPAMGTWILALLIVILLIGGASW